MLEGNGRGERYRLERPIGRGATGIVYAARRESDGELVALKMLAPELSRDPRFMARFLREARLASEISHPNAIRVFASGVMEGHLYLAMELVDGVDLAQTIADEGTLDVPRTLAILEQVASALDAAHERGLVHGDVKPQNVLVAHTPTGIRAVVCDFGIARASTDTPSDDETFAGTAAYVAPEQVQGRSLDGRADVYALGCLAFACLTGAPPFVRDSNLALLFAHLNEPPPSLSMRHADVGRSIEDAVGRALAKDPADRFPTCMEFVAAASASAPRRRLSRRMTLAAGFVVAVSAAAATLAAILQIDAPSRADITQSSIAGVSLGRLPAYYRQHLGGSRSQVQPDFHLPSIAFRVRRIAVYFPDDGEPADVITTWNRMYQTREGIGPCSMLAEMHRVYGDRLRATRAGTTGSVHWSWALGPNLLFVTHDHKTVADVVVYRGGLAGSFSSEAWANYIGTSETGCSR